MTKKILIVGGGAIGLFSAYYLRKAGHEVIVADKGDFSDNCSYGNAGLIVPSHIIPMASPGMVSAAFRYMFNPKAPVALKIPPSVDFLKWSARFVKSASHHHVYAASSVLKEICLLSKSLYKEIVEKDELFLEFEEKGLLIVCQSEKTQKEETEAAELSNYLDISAKVLSGDEISRMEPGLKPGLAGGVYYEGDCSLLPTQLMKSLIASLKEMGVTLMPNADMTSLGRKNGKVSHAVISDGEVGFDELVIAAGTWSNDLLKMVNGKVLLQPGRGYSFDVENNGAVQYPALLIDSRVSVTPFGNGNVRFGGGMELGYFGRNIFKKRFDEIFRAVKEYYPKLNIDKDSIRIWQGHRPCSFDGLPYIGRVPGSTNTYLATGHSMLGITLAPATGKLICELIDGNQTSMNVSPFRVDR